MPVKVALLSTPLMTAPPPASYNTIATTAEDVAELIKSNGYTSYIGHPGTAQALTELLRQDIPVHRGNFVQAVGQDAVAFRLNADRAPRGQAPDYTREQVEEMGYELVLITRTA